MQYETSGGDIIITIPNCDCRSTGGCEKCRPIIMKKNPDSITFNPFPLPIIKMRVLDNRLWYVDEGSPKGY